MLKIADLLKIVSLKDSLHPDSLRFLNCFLIQSPQTFVNYFLKTKADVCIYRDISTFGDFMAKMSNNNIFKKDIFQKLGYISVCSKILFVLYTDKKCKKRQKNN